MSSSTRDDPRLGRICPGGPDRRAGVELRRAGPDHLRAAERELDEPVVVTSDRYRQRGRVFGHLVIKVGAYANATVVLEHRGSAVRAGIVAMLVGDGAALTFVRCSSGPTTPCIRRPAARGRPGRQVRSRWPASAATWSGSPSTVEYAAPGGEVEQFGLYFADAGQHLEHRLFVDHNAPHTRSNVDYRGALQGQGAHSVWIGDVLIRKVAEGIRRTSRTRTWC